MNTAKKRALLISAISIAVCFTLLIGTTFAWFTDSVSSAQNVIVAGNLDIELTHTNKTATNETVEGATDLFVDVTPSYWEPGAMAMETFTLKNVGNLALKYSFSLNIHEATKLGKNNKSLAEVLKVAVIEGTVTDVTDRDSIPATEWKAFYEFEELGEILAGAADDVWTVVIWWEPSAIDNEYNMNNEDRENGRTTEIAFTIELHATQLSAETDSFDNTYDESATWAPAVTETETVAATETESETEAVTQ